MTADRPRPEEPPTRDDRTPTLAAVLGFSLALGIGTVAIPLVALDAGYAPATVGALVAVAAATQLGVRLTLPWLLGRFADRSLMAVSAIGLAGTFALLIVSTTLPVFVAAQLLQGGSRAIFWTSSMTHVVRGPGSSVRRIVDVNVAGNLGTLSGPAIAGTLAIVGMPLALAAAVGAGLVASLLSLRLHSLPAFDRRRSAGTLGLLRRPGVDVACWAGIIGGAWWAMVGSFVPIILVGAGIGATGVGWLTTASEGAGMVALLVQRRISGRARIGRRLVLAAIVVAGALAGIALCPPVLAVYAALLIVGGAASGTATTLGPALASLAAGPHEQGDALALSGTFRAAALFVAPAVVSAAVATLGIGSALAALSGVILLPGVVIAGRSRGVRRAAGSTTDR